MPIHRRILPQATVLAGEPAAQVPFDTATTIQLHIPHGKQVYYVYDDENPDVLIGIRFVNS